MKQAKKLPNNQLELKLISQGYSQIVGIDEVGRGCFAGPLFVCGYAYSIESKIISEINDSKLLSPKKREIFFESLKDDKYSVQEASVEEINEFGLGVMLKRLIAKIIDQYSEVNSYFLIDGRFNTNFSKNSSQVIKGDRTHYSISCASVIAKVLRDKKMQEYSITYPNYGFETNVGYGTATHINAIKKYGITPLHRINFKPLKEYQPRQSVTK